MADEIKRIITIDPGNSATTLKEFKQHIDQLRGSLLQLDESSDEYKEIAKEIQVEQDKLNNVMKVGKGYTDAADGSYNQLVQTMADLKKQWRATADEAERAQLGEQILQINDKLKDLDASTGNFQRNVGDYSNAFEEAFKNVLGNMQGIDGAIGVISSDVSRMIPLIKQTTKAATVGLNGIKKALVSTGIGALVVALGLILSHWQEISEWVRKTTGFVDTQAEAVKELQRQTEILNKKYEDANDHLAYSLELMKARGKSEIEQLEFTLATESKLQDEAYDEWSKAHSAYNNNKDNVDKKYVEGLKERLNEADKTLADRDRKVTETQRKINVYLQETITSLVDGSKEVDTELYNQMLQLQANLDEALKQTGQNAQLQIGIYRDYLAQAQKLYDDNNKEEIVVDKEAEQRAKQRREQAKKEAEDRKKQAKDIQKALEEANKDEVTKVREKYENEKRLLEQHGMDTTLLTQKYLDDVQGIFDQENEEIRQQQEEAGNQWLDSNMSKLEQATEQQLFELDLVNATTLEQEAEVARQRYDIERQLIEDKIALQEQFLQDYGGSLEDIGEAEQTLNNLKLELSNLDKSRAKEAADYKKKMDNEAAANSKIAWQSAAKSTADILSNLSDMMEEGSEEQKALSIMSTIINTIAGAIGAFKALADIPYVGPALGAAAAAAATTAGLAAIQQIKSTTKSSTNMQPTKIETVYQQAQVSPLLDQQADLNRMTQINAQPASQSQVDNRVYVVESDIREVGNRVNVRESNSTF